MPNTLLTPLAITREALRILHQKCNFIGSINRQYDPSFAKTGAKIGNSLRIRLPNEYTVRTGRVLSAQDTTETQVTLDVTTQKGVDVQFTSEERTMSLDDFSTRILTPAITRLAAAMETDAMSMYKDVYQQVNNTGATATYNGILDGRVLLQNSLTPDDMRTANVNPRDMSNIVKDTKTLFNNQSAIGTQYKEGYMGRAGGFDFMENTLWGSHARGAGAGYVVNGASQTGSSLVVGTGTGAIPKGEAFTIAGVFSVHPESKASTGILQQFVVTADFAGGAGTLSIAPAITPTGARQNVTASPAAAAAITIAGTASTPYGISMLYHKDAFTFATADLEMPEGVDFSARREIDGLSMRIVRAYDINTDNFPCRIDVFYGWKTLRAQLAARYANQAT